MISTLKNGRQRITVVMPSASPTGGAEEAFWQLIKSDAAAKVRWQSIFLEAGPLVQQVKSFVDESITVSCGRTREVWKWWKAASQISAYAKSFGSDLILGWMTKGHVYGGLAAWRAGIPAAWFQMGIPEGGFLDRASRSLPASTVFTCSEFVAELQRAAQPKANVVPVSLGVDLTRFDLSQLPSPIEAQQQLGLPSQGPIIGIVGRLQRWKGMHVLIDAMPKILLQHPAAHCVVVGGPYPAEPEYETELRGQVANLGITDKVTFAGAQTNVPLWMQAMDLFVHASREEPFGIVIVEALSLAKPVVACAPGGPSEIVGPDVIGQLVPFGDADALAHAVCDELLQGTSAAQNQAVAKRFSHEAFSSTVISSLKRYASCEQFN